MASHPFEGSVKSQFVYVPDILHKHIKRHKDTQLLDRKKQESLQFILENIPAYARWVDLQFCTQFKR